MGIIKPIKRVMRRIAKSDDISKMRALEVFGYTGAYHTIYYADKVKSLDVWEINSSCLSELNRNLPNANIKITDSYFEVQRSKKKYDLIVIDNPMSIHGDKCEHFNLFPFAFNLIEDQGIFIVNVIPKISAKTKKKYPYLFNYDQLKRRSDFYQTSEPNDISLLHLAEQYKIKANLKQLEVKWGYFVKRTDVYYYIFKVIK